MPTIDYYWTSAERRCTSTIMRTIPIVIICLVLSVVAWTQRESAAKDHEPTFEWSQRRDVEKWLADNKTVLDQGDACTLNVDWAGTGNAAGSALHSIESFVITPDDGEVVRLIHDSVSGSGVDVRVGVRYLRSESWPLAELNLVIALEGSPEHVFDQVGRSEVKIGRDNNWKLVTVAKHTELKGIRYSYKLTCENGKTFLDFLRRPAKRESD